MCFSSAMTRITWESFESIGLNRPPVSETQKNIAMCINTHKKVVKNLFE